MAKPSPKYSNNPALVALGVTLRSARTSLGLSQEMIANNSNLDRSYVSGIERGEHNITLMNLLKIAEQLDKKPSEILREAGL